MLIIINLLKVCNKLKMFLKDNLVLSSQEIIFDESYNFFDKRIKNAPNLQTILK